MKLKRLFLGLFILSINLLIFTLAEDISYISIDTVYAHKDRVEGKIDPRWYLINVLPDGISGECFIPGSISIPTHKLEKKLSNSKKWPRDRKIILYCAGADCPLSRYAYDIVKKLGFNDVQVLEGGVVEWIQNKLPIQGGCIFEYLTRQ